MSFVNINDTPIPLNVGTQPFFFPFIINWHDSCVVFLLLYHCSYVPNLGSKTISFVHDTGNKCKTFCDSRRRIVFAVTKR